MMREFLTGLQAEYEKIAQNQIGRLKPGLSADEVISACEKLVENTGAFRRNTDTLLKKHLYPMLENIAAISDEEEAEMYDTAQRLSSYAARIDPGLALKIYQGLLQWARSRGDVAKTIRYLYWCGITTFFFFRTQNMSGEQDKEITAYFEEGASYSDRYHSFDDPETRQYIHRCLGNKSMMYYHTHGAKKAIESEELCFSFWNQLLFMGKDLDFPWLNYFMACLNHRHGHLATTAHTDPDGATKAELREILDIAITINKLYSKNRDSFSVFGGTRYEFMLWEAQFLSDLISFDHLYENCYRKKAEFSPDDFSPDALFVKLQLNSYLMFYAAKMQKLKDRKDDIIAAVSKDAVDAFSLIPMSVSPANVSEHLRFFASNLSDVFDPVEQMDFVLRMTTFRHIPTYAHSIMVGKISEYLTKRLINQCPDRFIGCLGFDNAGEVAEHADDLYRFVEIGSLCHDIGKISYVCNPYMHTRLLTDEEYAVIKAHPEDGAAMLTRDDNADINSAYIEVIMGHHKFYDNSGGYPEDYDTSKLKNKMLIDIIAVANVIDSATDLIGRAYSEPKTLDGIIAEISSGAGVLYSPIVAGALKDDAVAAEIKHILDVDRKNAYYTAYLHAWSNEGGKRE